MGRVRYIIDRKLYFVKITLVLNDGRELTAIDDTTVSDIDANWYVYLSKAQNKWEGKINSFQLVQLSMHDPEVKQYMKANNIHFPSEVQNQEIHAVEMPKPGTQEQKPIHKLPAKSNWQSGKYRS